MSDVAEIKDEIRESAEELRDEEGLGRTEIKNILLEVLDEVVPV